MLQHFSTEIAGFLIDEDDLVALEHVLDQYINASEIELNEETETLVKDLGFLAFKAGRSYQQELNDEDNGLVTLRLDPQKAANLLELLLGG